MDSKKGKEGYTCLKTGGVLICYILVSYTIACVMQTIDTGGWAGVDAERFHQMARMIINGFTPYVSFVDPKPPLLFFVVSLMDLMQPPGTLDLPVMTSINVFCAILIYYIGSRDYGYVSGFTAGFLYLIVAAFVQGYFLFSEQFAVLFLLLAFIFARNSTFIPAGICIGLACGFKQYAIIGIIPLIYLMRAQKNTQYSYLLIPAVIIAASSFFIIFVIYGGDAFLGSLYWTFGVAPDYISGQEVAQIPSYQTKKLFSYSVYLISSIFVVLPVVIFAAASLTQRGLRSSMEVTIFLFAALLSGTLLIRQYLHYWILILPFLLLLACREFAEKK